ncbi:MAG: RNA pseudouridine synthase [Moraxellaceae bacterium]|nr:MAG: RNA pseudouridine synthase [Moraxellaceae bacterium]
MTEEHFELHLTATQPILAPDLLSDNCGLSKQRLKLAMQKGAVWVTPNKQDGHTQRLRRAKKMLNAGDCLHLYYDRAVLDSVATPSELIDDLVDYSVWNKPCGTFSQGSKWGDHCTVARWAEKNLLPERPAFVVHRLDRATSGLILLAHTKRTARSLSQLFENRGIKKRYRALVHGEFPCGTQTVNSNIDNRVACSHFDLLQSFPERELSLVEVQIETGRKHQIRRHLAELGFPIVGDRLHGVENSIATSLDLQLCAFSLCFTCPITGEEKFFELAAGKQPWMDHLKLQQS